MRTKSATKQQRKILANVSLLSHTNNKALEPPSKLFRELSFVIQSSPLEPGLNRDTLVQPRLRLPLIFDCPEYYDVSKREFHARSRP
jgi:hypothetical protein